MKYALSHAAVELQRSENRAFVRRVMWIDFEERLQATFAEMCVNQRDSDELGRLYLTLSSAGNPAYVRERILRAHSINNAQIHTGWRRFGVMHTISLTDGSHAKEAMEHGASIVFSQNISGRVGVFLYPFECDLTKVKEENIILMLVQEPAALTKRKIEHCLRQYLRYCVASSAMSMEEPKNYLFRMKLSFFDFRNRQIQKRNVLLLVERFLLITFAALGVWATLLTGNKWPL